MAFRYPEDYPQDGDILEPKDWLRSQQAMAGEFNGKLDRDNFPESAFDNTHCADGTFTLVEVDRQNNASIDSPAGVSTWVNGDGTDPFHYLEFEVGADVGVEIHWSGYWVWVDASAPGFPWDLNDDDPIVVGWRVTVDGEEVARSPIHSKLRQYDSTGLVAFIALPPGPHTIEVECYVRNESTGAQVADYITYDYGELIAVITKR